MYPLISSTKSGSSARVRPLEDRAPFQVLTNKESTMTSVEGHTSIKQPSSFLSCQSHTIRRVHSATTIKAFLKNIHTS